MADEKKYFRAILKRARDSIATSLAAALSARVQALILAADFYRQCSAVLLYSAIANEVSTDAILDDALASGRAVFYPRLGCAGMELSVGKLSIGKIDSRADLAPGQYGILQPNRATVDPAAMGPCTVLVPGVAFTARGERIGRGGGHYDRLLAELSPQAITVGLAYSFQLLERIPQSGWDRRLNFVVTDRAVYSASGLMRTGGAFGTQGGIPR
jgi:5-formyltetrahydrofolate cyclo-ligase